MPCHIVADHLQHREGPFTHEKMLKLSCLSDSELHDYYVITKYLTQQHFLIDTPIVSDVTAP